MIPYFCNVVEIDLLENKKITFMKYIGGDLEIKRDYRISNILNDNSSISISNEFLTGYVSLNPIKYNSIDDISIEVFKYLENLEIETIKIDSNKLTEDILRKNILDIGVKMYSDSDQFPSYLYAGKNTWIELFPLCCFDGDNVKIGSLEVYTHNINDNLIIISSKPNKLNSVEFGICVFLDVVNNLYFIFDLYPKKNIKFIELI